MRPFFGLCLILVTSATLSGAVNSPGRPDTAAPAPQPAPPIPHSGYVERETSELVLIETYATDGLGHPVTDLTREDFILEVGGLRRTIESADYHDGGSLAESAAGVDATAPAPGVRRGWPRRVVLLFGDDTAGAINMTQARQAALRFLESGLLPTDEVAVATAGRGLRYLQTFTTDRGLLKDAIGTSLASASRFTDLWSDMSGLWEELSEHPDPALALTICEQMKGRYAAALKALETAATSLSGWRGSKMIVYMGSGVPQSPMEEWWKAYDKSTQRKPATVFMRGGGSSFKSPPPSPKPAFEMRCTLADEIKNVTRVAAASGVTISTVQTAGLTAGTAAQMKASARSSSTLDTLALNTAGVSTKTNDLLAALREIDTASRSYYTLAYAPLEAADGRYRHIVVRCRRPGVQLRYRRGFVRLPPAEARAQVIEAAWVAPEMYGGLGLDLAFAEGPVSRDERIVDLVLHVPFRALLFLPQADGAAARLSIGFVALDEHRTKTLDTSRSVTLRRPAEGGQVDGADIYCRARLPLGAQEVTAVIADEQGGAIGGARRQLAAGVSPDAAVLGLSLYSLVQKSLWIEVPQARPGGEAEARDPHSAVGPALKNTFDPGEPIVVGFRLPLEAASVPAAFRVDIRRGDDLVRSRTVDVDTGPGTHPGSIRLPLPVDGLASGDYVVTIHAVAGDADTTLGRASLRISEPDTGT